MLRSSVWSLALSAQAAAGSAAAHRNAPLLPVLHSKDLKKPQPRPRLEIEEPWVQCSHVLAELCWCLGGPSFIPYQGPQ